jgi:hypothetical protein
LASLQIVVDDVAARLRKGLARFASHPNRKKVSNAHLLGRLDSILASLETTRGVIIRLRVLLSTEQDPEIAR